MANEDFTTYTETDDSSTLTVTSSRVTFTSTPFAHTTQAHHVTKDHGASHFGDFEHLLTVLHSATTTSQWGTQWSMDNAGTGHDGFAGGGDVLMVIPEADFSAAIYDSSTTNYDGPAATYENTVLYVKIARTGTTFTMEIYDDSGRTNLLATLSITCSSTAFRYLSVAAGFVGIDDSYNTTGYVENLDLQEGGGGGSSIKTWNGLADASTKTVNGLARASVKTWDGLA